MSSPGSAPAVGGPTPLLAFVLMSLAGFASAASMRVTDPMLPYFSSEFGISLGAASYAVSMFAVAYGVAQVIGGPLGDRFGKCRVIALACLLSGVASTLCALAPNFETFLVGRLLTGAASSALMPLAMAWIGDVVTYERRQAVLARFLLGQIAGVATGALLGGAAADFLGRHWPFAGISVVFLLIGWMLWVQEKKLPAFARQRNAASGHFLADSIAAYRDVVSRSWARVILSTASLEGAFLFGALAFAAAHLHATLHISLFHAGSLLMLIALGGLIFALGSKQLVRRLGEPKMAICGGALLLTGFSLIGFSQHWLTAAVGCTVLGLGFYMLHNTLQANATQMAPERRGAAVSSFASVYFLGQSLGVWLFGMLISITGSTRAVMVIGGMGCLAIGLNFSRLRRRQLRREQDTAALVQV